MRNFTTKEILSRSYLTSKTKRCLGILLLSLILFLEVLPRHINAQPTVVGVDAGSAAIEGFNVGSWVGNGAVTLTLAGFTISGAQAITWNSDNLLFYAIVTVTGPPIGRRLVTVNPLTGVCTDIGSLGSGPGSAYSSLTYNSDLGILYAMGGSGADTATISQRLFSVNITTAATTLLAGPFPVGDFGEVISYNYDDDMIYHWSGQGMEKIDPVTFVATPVITSGDPHGEITGAVYIGNGVFAATDLIFLGPTGGLTITSAGVFDFQENTNYRIRGLAYVDPLLPVELSSFVSSIRQNDVTLNWSTTTETNNSGFEIQRSIVNGQWSVVGNVTGNGTSATPNNYSYTDRNLSSGNYNYRLKQIDFNGNFEYFILGNEVLVGIPDRFELSQNYPNPFNPSTKIEYQLPKEGNVNISVYDNSGKEVMSLVNEFKAAGYYTINFNGSSLSSGIYFYKISSGDFSGVKKMMLVK